MKTHGLCLPNTDHSHLVLKNCKLHSQQCKGSAQGTGTAYTLNRQNTSPASKPALYARQQGNMDHTFSSKL